MREAPAQYVRHPFLNLAFGRFRILVQKRLRRQDDAIQAKSALRGLLGDKSFLKWVGFFDGAQSLQRGDLRSLDGFYRGDARTDRGALDDHRASATLAQAATKFRAAKREVVAQNVKQWSGWINIQGVRAAIHVQRYRAHMSPKYAGDRFSSRPVPVYGRCANLSGVAVKNTACSDIEICVPQVGKAERVVPAYSIPQVQLRISCGPAFSCSLENQRERMCPT